MTITTEVTTCPICGNLFHFENQIKLAITHNELTILSNYIKNGMLKDMINIADIAIRRLAPEKIDTQLQITEGLIEFRQQSYELIKTLVKETKDLIEELSQANEDGRIKTLNEFGKKIIQLTSQWQTTIDKGKEIQNQHLKNIQKLINP